jgi:hypothetical protein
MYKTTFEKEVWSDLYGERGCLMGGIHGMFLAQYEVLRERGHSPSEAFNETVEEATQSLYPLIGANGMDWMYAACSTTARRGAIDWSGKFKDTLKPVFNELYDSVKNGTETKRSLDFNGQPDYREKLEAELKTIRELEIWRAGKAVRSVETILFDCKFVANILSKIPSAGEPSVNRYPKVYCFSSQALRANTDSFSELNNSCVSKIKFLTCLLLQIFLLRRLACNLSSCNDFLASRSRSPYRFRL